MFRSVICAIRVFTAARGIRVIRVIYIVRGTCGFGTISASRTIRVYSNTDRIRASNGVCVIHVCSFHSCC